MKKEKKGFSKLLFYKRGELNLSLREIAEQTNIHPSYLWRLEMDDARSPSFEVVCKLIEVLSLDVKEVFDAFGYGYLLNHVKTEDVLIGKIQNEVKRAVAEEGFGYVSRIVELIEEEKRKLMCSSS
ncbi:UNVERIFIED_ORG: helix-turn-helix protein [Anoxybacillus amylolyticus]